MENSIFKLHVRNFINMSSFYGLLDLIYTEISTTMKSIHSLDLKNFLLVRHATI